MMRGTRLSVVASDLPADAFLKLARGAEDCGLSAAWAHSRQRVSSPGAGDGAVLAAVSASASVTTHIRLGVFLAPHDHLARLRAAEDLGVIDQSSGGRMELGLGRLDVEDGPVPDRDGWMQLLRAWRSWIGASGECLAVTPAPAQPWLPRLFVDDEPAAQSLGGGVLLTEPAAPSQGFLHRRVLLERRTELARPKRAEAVLMELTALRARLLLSDADEAMVEVDASALNEGIRWLGTVIQPGLRFDDSELPDLVRRAVDWFEKGTSRW